MEKWTSVKSFIPFEPLELDSFSPSLLGFALTHVVPRGHDIPPQFIIELKHMIPVGFSYTHEPQKEFENFRIFCWTFVAELHIVGIIREATWLRVPGFSVRPA